MKICSKCKKAKELDEFHRGIGYKDGKRTDCKDCRAVWSNQYYKANKDRIVEYGRQYDEQHREKINKRERARRQNNLHYKMNKCLRVRIWAALQRNSKGGSTIELVGCTIEELRRHIESQFQEGMSWDNWTPDGWHLDHVRPCASFDLTDPEQQKLCFHYTNLQPLWAEDNYQKSGRWEGVNRRGYRATG